VITLLVSALVYLAVVRVDDAVVRSEMMSELDRRAEMIDVLLSFMPAMPMAGPESAATALAAAHPDWIVRLEGDTVEVNEIRLIYGDGRLVRAETFGHR
jgi:hypothetical protein